MSRLNTMYPDDEFLKNISDMMGKLDNKNETEIKQEIEQIGYKEFYRYSKEKDVYIKQLKEEKQEWINLLDMFKNQQKKFIEYLEDEKDRLARECSQIYEDSLGKTRLVNEDIFNEVNDILQKYKSIIGVLDEESNNISS